MATADKVCAQIASARQRILGSVRGLSEKQSKLRPADGGWSAIEVLAHMIDVDDYYLGQAMLLRDQPNAVFNYFDDDAWKAAHPAPDEFALRDVLDQLTASHQRVLEATFRLTKKELGRPGLQPRGIPYTVADVFLRLPTHDDNHRQQLDEILARLSTQP